MALLYQRVTNRSET